MEYISKESLWQQPAKNDSPPPPTAEQISTSRHEAGHATLAEVLHIGLDSVSVHATKGAQGHTALAKKIQDVNLSALPPLKRIALATRLCVVCLGGAASLTMLEGDADWDTAREDLSVYDSLIPSAGTAPEDERAFFLQLFARATTLIHQHREEVEAIADALVERRTLDGAQIGAIAQKVRHDGKE